MTAFNMTEDQAITAITVGIDFSVSQVTQQLPHAVAARHRKSYQDSTCTHCRALEKIIDFAVLAPHPYIVCAFLLVALELVHMGGLQAMNC